MTEEPDKTMLRELYTHEEVIDLINEEGFAFELEVFQNVAGDEVCCLYDNSDDGPSWHVLLGLQKELLEGFDFVLYLPTLENPYRAANEWNEKHYKSVMTVMSDSESNAMYLYPYFALRLCSTVDFEQLVTVNGFKKHLADWLIDVDEALELFPYEPESTSGDGSQNSDI